MAKALARVASAWAGLTMLTACAAHAPQASMARPPVPRAATAARSPAVRRAPAKPARPTKPPGAPGVSTAALPHIYGMQMVSPTTGWINAGALFRTTNGAQTWTEVFQRPGAVLAWAAPTSESAWVVMQARSGDQVQVWSTTDAGVEWHAVTLSTPWAITEVHLQVGADGTGTVVASGQSVNSMQTTQQRLWHIVGNTVITAAMYTTNNGQFLAASWASPSDGWATASSAAINDLQAVLFQTTDGGRQWLGVPLPLPPNVPHPAPSSRLMPFLLLGHAPTFVEPGDGYVAAQLSYGTATTPPTTYPVLYQTTNDRTWTPVWMGPPHHAFTQLQWITATAAWAVLRPTANATSTWIVVSTSGGRAWSRALAPDPSDHLTYDLVAVSPTEAVLYALSSTQALTVYATTNGGQTWQARS